MAGLEAIGMYVFSALGGAYNNEITPIKVDSFDPSQGHFKYIVIDGVTTRVRDEDYIGAIATKALAAYNDKQRQQTGYFKVSDLEQLSVTTVAIPENFAGLEAESIPTRLENQLFRIVEVVENEDYVEVTARHVWYDNLKDFTWWKPDDDTTEYTAGAVCRAVMENSGGNTCSRVATDCTDSKPGSEFDYYNKNLVEVFLDPENGICHKFGLSLLRYNWDFYVLKNVGYNRGFVVENGKNLLGVERTESIENVATRVSPYGKDEKGEIVWLDNEGNSYIDSQYIDEYAVPMREVYDTGLVIGKGGVTAENIQEKLLAAGQARFDEDHIDLPEVQMTIEFLSLGDTEEYIQYRDLDKVYLYDIITVKDTVRKYSYTAQVIEVEHDVLTGMLKSITIGKLDNWDGTRKIATWQVPEVDGANIRLKSILAGAFEPGAIGADDLQEAIIEYAHFKTATIDALTADSIDAVTARIHEIIAGSITANDIVSGSITTDLLAAGVITSDKIDAGAVTADKITAGAITADKIGANAITTEKLAASAITTDKLAAGSITASKIDTNDLSAIHATLGTADIADARIAVADINFAHIKDLSASSAYFGQAVFQEAVGGKLFVPRLMVGYAQMVAATIGDLVMKATDGNYYHLDVNASTGAVTAQQVHPTAEEIESGHTSTGQTIIDTDIVAENLSTANIYATHALMDEINANIISADRLFAREATIAKINAMDLSSNTYIQATVGDWNSGSTITQTINGINTRISSLGYGTFYYSETEPDPSGIVVGDVWIQPIEDNTWDDISSFTWDQLSEMTWEQVAGKYRMYVWTGSTWKLLFDNQIYNELQTQINQNAYAITLKANASTVNELSGEITEFQATLDVQADAINSAVQTVNMKGTTFVQLTDPTLEYDVHVGDTWSRGLLGGTWADVANYTWDDIAALTWDDLAGAKTYMWDGSKWVLSSDAGAILNMRTEINQTAEEILLQAQKIETIEGETRTNSARISITADRITQEVERATSAESRMIQKTTKYQTADEIVQEAYSQSIAEGGRLYIQKTGIYQSANDIVIEAVEQAVESAESAGDQTYIKKSGIYVTPEKIVSESVRQAKSDAAGSYIKKTTQYQTADAIVSEAVSQSSISAGNSYIAKTSRMQTADAIKQEAVAEAVPEAVSQAGAAAGAAYISKTAIYQTADSIRLAAELNAKDYTDANAYAIKSGIEIKAAGIEISGSKYIKIKSGGSFQVDSNNFNISTAGVVTTAGFTIENGWMYSGSGANCVTINGSNPHASASAYALWAGADWPDASPNQGQTGYAPFRVMRDGTVVITKLLVQDGQTTKQVDLFRNFSEAGRVKEWECTWNQSQSSGNIYCTVKAVTNTGTFYSPEFYVPN